MYVHIQCTLFQQDSRNTIKWGISVAWNGGMELQNRNLKTVLRIIELIG